MPHTLNSQPQTLKSKTLKQVGLVDPGGNVVLGASAAAVELTLTKQGELPASGVLLSGTTTVVALDGIASFTDLALDRQWVSGVGYDNSFDNSTGLTLTFSAGSYS